MLNWHELYPSQSFRLKYGSRKMSGFQVISSILFMTKMSEYVFVSGLFSFRFFCYILSQLLICYNSIVGRVEQSETRQESNVSGFALLYPTYKINSQ